MFDVYQTAGPTSLSEKKHMAIQRALLQGQKYLFCSRAIFGLPYVFFRKTSRPGSLVHSDKKTLHTIARVITGKMTDRRLPITQKATRVHRDQLNIAPVTKLIKYLTGASPV